MVDKRGQLTIFIIVGVVIVVGIVAFFIYQGGSEDRYFSQPDVSEGVSEIEEYLGGCFDYVSEVSMHNVMMQGGYYDRPSRVEAFDEDNATFLPYYYYEGEENMPSIETIEAELAKSMDEMAPGCVDIAEFTNFDVSYSRVETSVDIRDEEVVFTVDMPIKLEKEGHVMIIDMKNRPVSVPSRLKGMHNVAQYYVTDVSQGDASYCVNCLGDLAIANGVSVDIVGIGPTTSSVILSEDMGGAANFTYFFFLTKFTEEEMYGDEITPPQGYDVD